MVGNHQTSIYKWLFGVPGDNRPFAQKRKHPSSGAFAVKLTGNVCAFTSTVILEGLQNATRPKSVVTII